MAKSAGMVTMLIGCMGSGKTTELCRLLNIHRIAGDRCVLIKSAVDTRHASDVKTHDSTGTRADKVCTLLSEVTDADVDHANVIGIDEGQFFADLAERCEHWASRGKVVYVACLKSTAEGDAFPPVAALFPRAEEIRDLAAVCLPCRSGVKARASFTFDRGDRSSGPIHIGGPERYTAVCRSCRDRLRAEASAAAPAKPPTLVADTPPTASDA